MQTRGGVTLGLHHQHARGSPGVRQRQEVPRPTPGLLRLQQQAGNRAVGGLLQRRKDPAGATDPVADVQGTGITRIKVDGLKLGNADDFHSKYPTLSGDAESGERNMTDQSPQHTAVVLLPDKVIEGQDLQVLLHFHGWGFREGTDPYAGYLEGKGRKKGTFRDTHQEHLEEQLGPLEATVRGGRRQIVAVLPQGIGTSIFGKVPTTPYVKEVLERSGRFTGGVPPFSVILSAHSGGGSNQVIPKVGAGEADDGPGGPDKPRVDMVTLYEAIHGDGEVSSLVAWVDKHLDRLAPILTKHADPEKDAPLWEQQLELGTTPKLRGYFGDRKRSGYAGRYVDLSRRITAAIDKKIPLERRQEVYDLFRIVRVTDPGGGEVGHEQVIAGKQADHAAGMLARALQAQRDPTSDRDLDIRPAQAPVPTKQDPAKPLARMVQRDQQKPVRPGEKWYMGPVTERKSKTHTLADYADWVQQVEGRFGKDRESALQSIRKLYYSSRSGAAGKAFDSVIQDQGRGRELALDTAPAAALDGLFETDVVTTPQGQVVDITHALAAIDVQLSGVTWKAQAGAALYGLDWLGTVTWAGDLASWFLEYGRVLKVREDQEMAERAKHPAEGDDLEGGPLTERPSSIDKRALLDEVAQSKASKDDLLGDIDAELMARAYVQASSPGRYGDGGRLFHDADAGKELDRPLSDILRSYYGVGAAGPAAGAGVQANRFRYFVVLSKPAIPYVPGLTGGLTLAADAEPAIRAAIASSAHLFRDKGGMGRKDVDPFTHFKHTLDDIAARFTRFLATGLAQGDAPWP